MKKPYRELDWFRVSRAEQFLVGETLRIVGVGEGYYKALDYARLLAERPHDRINRDLLTAECNEVAELFLKIALEDGNALSLGAALAAMVREAGSA